MMALSIRQPWADLILRRGKDIENRTWPLPPELVGERIMIHAGKRSDPDWWQAETELDFLADPIEPEHIELARYGAILGEVTLVECVEIHPSPWFFGPYGFVLADPVEYANPVPCRGRLGFFDPKITESDVSAARPEGSESPERQAPPRASRSQPQRPSTPTPPSQLRLL